jgi:hypothetical protein
VIDFLLGQGGFDVEHARHDGATALHLAGLGKTGEHATAAQLLLDAAANGETTAMKGAAKV